jgi:hypothetical protein
MKPQISEFSFGYALTEALVRDSSSPVIAAPLFPSLYQEGKPGGGYDVMLNTGEAFLFIQFKLSDCMVKRNAQECVNGHFSPPFFRMHLRPRWSSNQHAMLMALANQGHWVFYAAPTFYTQNDFNRAYIGGSIIDKTFFIGPPEIGLFTDDEDHHVAFDAAHNRMAFSKVPRKVGGRMGRAWTEKVTNELRERSRKPLSRDDAAKTAYAVTEVLSSFARTEDRLLLEKRLREQEEHPLAQLATVSRTFLDCELLLAGLPESQ